MTSFKLNEPVIDGVIAKLNDGTTGVASEIAVINAADTKGIQLENFTHVLDYIPSPVELDGLGYPVLAMTDGEVTFEDDTGWAATAVFEFFVVVYVQEEDQRRLSWKLRRYATAVANCILRGRVINTVAGTDTGWSVHFVGAKPGPTLGREEQPRTWVSYRVLAFEVRSEQDQSQ